MRANSLSRKTDRSDGDKMKIKTYFLILTILAFSSSGFSKCLENSLEEVNPEACEVGNNSILIAQITDQGIQKIIPKAISFVNEFSQKISSTGKIIRNCKEVDAQLKVPNFKISSEDLCIKKMHSYMPVDALTYSCGQSTSWNKACAAPEAICKKICSSPKKMANYLEFLNRKKIKKKEKKENKLSVISELCPSFPEGIEDFILNNKYQTALLNLLDYDKMTVKSNSKIAHEIFIGRSASFGVKQAINVKRGLKLLSEVKNLNNRLIPFQVQLENLVVDTPQDVNITLPAQQPKDGLKICASLKVPLNGDIRLYSHNGNDFDDTIFKDFNYQNIKMNLKINKDHSICFSSKLKNGKISDIQIINLEQIIESISNIENKLFSIDLESSKATEAGKELFSNFIYPILNKAIFSKVNQEQSFISKAFPVKRINSIIQNKINEATKKIIPTISKIGTKLDLPELPINKLQKYLDKSQTTPDSVETIQSKLVFSETTHLPLLTSGVGNFCPNSNLKEELDFNCNSDLKARIDLQTLEDTLSKLNKNHNFFDLCINMKLNEYKTLDFKSYCTSIKDSKNAVSCEMSNAESFSIGLSQDNQINLSPPTLNCKTYNHVTPSKENGLLEINTDDKNTTSIDGLINIETFKLKPVFKINLSLVNNNIALELKQVSGTHLDNGGLSAIINRELGKLMNMPLKTNDSSEKALSPLNRIIQDKNQYIDFLKINERDKSLQICADLKESVLNE